MATLARGHHQQCTKRRARQPALIVILQLARFPDPICLRSDLLEQPAGICGDSLGLTSSSYTLSAIATLSAGYPRSHSWLVSRRNCIICTKKNNSKIKSMACGRCFRHHTTTLARQNGGWQGRHTLSASSAPNFSRATRTAASGNPICT